jgi:hypothetical protein
MNVSELKRVDGQTYFMRFVQATEQSTEMRNVRIVQGYEN